MHDMFDILSAINQYVDDNGEEINHMNGENFYWGSLDKSPGEKVYNSDANDYWNNPNYWSFSHSVYNPVQGDFIPLWNTMGRKLTRWILTHFKPMFLPLLVTKSIRRRAWRSCKRCVF